MLTRKVILSLLTVTVFGYTLRTYFHYYAFHMILDLVSEPGEQNVILLWFILMRFATKTLGVLSTPKRKFARTRLVFAVKPARRNTKFSNRNPGSLRVALGPWERTGNVLKYTKMRFSLCWFALKKTVFEYWVFSSGFHVPQMKMKITNL